MSASLPFTLQVEPLLLPVLLMVRGELADDDLETARQTHNAVAGSDAAIAMARSFSDLSHAVYTPLAPPAQGAGELLILDYWNNPEGIGRFFGDPQVAQGGQALFKDREPSVWVTQADLPSVHFPAPAGRGEVYVALLRGRVRDRASAPEALSLYTRLGLNQGRARGLLAREFYFRAPPPGADASDEVLGVDLWCDLEGMGQHYADPANAGILKETLVGPPETSAWRKPAGHWIEW